MSLSSPEVSRVSSTAFSVSICASGWRARNAMISFSKTLSYTMALCTTRTLQSPAWCYLVLLNSMYATHSPVTHFREQLRCGAHYFEAEIAIL